MPRTGSSIVVPFRQAFARAPRRLPWPALAASFVIASVAQSQCAPQWLPGLGFGPANDQLETVHVAGDGTLFSGGGQLRLWNGVQWSTIARPFDASFPLARILAAADVGPGVVAFGGETLSSLSGVWSWNGTTWTILGQPFLTTFGQDATIVALERLPNGHLVAAHHVGGVHEWNGSTWTQLGALHGTLADLAVLPNGDLVACGVMSVPGSSGPQGVASWNGSTWSTQGIGIGLGGGAVPQYYVDELAVLPNGDLIAGGGFPAPGGDNLARWNGTSWSGLGGGLSEYPLLRLQVHALEVLANGDLIVGGWFPDAGGVPGTEGLARWDGANWWPLGSGVHQSGNAPRIRSLAELQDGQLVVAGAMDDAGGVPFTQGLARWGCPIGVADVVPYGAGCYDGAVSFYERSDGAVLFDLSQSTLRLTPAGTGYTVNHLPGPPAFMTPVSPDLALGDDELSAPILLPFSIPYPAGSSNEILVSSNGDVFLQAAGAAPWSMYGDAAFLLTGEARLAVLNVDIQPAAGGGAGTIHVDIDGMSQKVTVTWSGVQEYGSPTALMTFQVEISATGSAEYRYQACGPTLGWVTGFSPGNGARDPGNRDLSISTPFSTAADAWPLALAATTRPGLGVTMTLECTEVPAASPFGVIVLGWTRHVPGIALDNSGMPGCFQHVSADSVAGFLPVNGVGGQVIAVPNDVAFVGTRVFGQAAAFVPGINALGAISSNGIELLLGRM